MTKIITHSGIAHLDDFLSTCLILYKDNTVDTIYRQAEVSEGDLRDPIIWKVDISETYDPDIKAFDHHQEDMNDCSFSLLLKHWGVWEEANEVYSWIPKVVEIDTSGLGAFINQHGISYEVYFQLDSFIKTALKELFQKLKRIERSNNRHRLLFLIMKQIGKEFFTGISTYKKLFESFNSHLDIQFMSKHKIEEDPKKGIPVLLYLTEDSQYCSHLFNVFHKYKTENLLDNRSGWITAFTYDRPKDTICLKRHGNPNHIDFFKLVSLEKTCFAHEKGFVAVVKKMPEEELYTYIQHALI